MFQHAVSKDTGTDNDILTILSCIIEKLIWRNQANICQMMLLFVVSDAYCYASECLLDAFD